MKTRNIAIVTRVIVGDKENEFTSDRYWGRPRTIEESNLPNSEKLWDLFDDENLDVSYNLKVINAPLILSKCGEEFDYFVKYLKEQTDINNFFKKENDNLLLYHTDDSNLVTQIEEGFKDIKKRKFSSVQDTNTFYEPVYQRLAQLCQTMLKGEDIEEEIKITEFHQLLDDLWNGGISNGNLEVILQTLHFCLTPDGAKKVKEIAGFDDIKETKIDGEKLHDYIENHLVPKSNDEALTESYIMPLIKMRDELLKSAL